MKNKEQKSLYPKKLKSSSREQGRRNQDMGAKWEDVPTSEESVGKLIEQMREQTPLPPNWLQKRDTTRKR